MNVVELASVPEQPWRNGGGLTRELLAWPAAVPWQLRVSVAEITRDGGFSAFPGVQRWFAVIEGAGVELDFDGRRALLTPDSVPCTFDGAAAPACRLIDGGTRDLNLMVQQHAGLGDMLPVAPGVPWHSSAAWRGVFSAGPLQLHMGNAASLALSAGSLAWHDDAAGQSWHCTGGSGPAWWLSMHLHAH